MPYANVPHEQHTIEATITPRPEAKGKEWEVVIIGPSNGIEMVEGHEYIRSTNDRMYSCRGLEASVPMWEGVLVYDNHLTDNEFKARAGMRSILEEGLGAIVDVRWDKESRELRGTLKVVDDRAARKLLNYHKAGIMGTIGLSMDTFPDDRMAVVEGHRIKLTEGFKHIMSVDLVANPAAGGGFNRLIAATQTMEANMPATLEQLEARIAALEEALSASEQDEVGGPAPETPEEVVALDVT